MKNKIMNHKPKAHLLFVSVAFMYAILLSCHRDEATDEVVVDASQKELKTSDDSIETIPITSFLTAGESLTLEILDIETENQSSFEKLYKSEIEMISKDEVAIILKDDKNCDKDIVSLVFKSDGTSGIGQSYEPEINDFVIRNYTDWCGRWRGRRRMWRICTGSDCGEGIAICFQRKLPNLPL